MSNVVGDTGTKVKRAKVKQFLSTVGTCLDLSQVQGKQPGEKC